MNHRRIVPLVLTLIVGATVACAPLSGLEDIGLGGDDSTAGARGAATDTDRLTMRSTTLKGDDFTQDVVLARTFTEKYWQQQFEADGRTYEPIRKFIPYVGNNGPACGDQPASPDNAFYCPVGHFIAFDKDWLKGLYDKIGDGAVYVIIPHELGHAVQAQLTTDFRFNKQRELQADCYAGGVIGWLVQAGRLQAEQGDEEELLNNLEAAGDPTDAWWRPDAHGTGPQRQEAFRTGYEQGVGAC
ncbi:MAG TPA: neutral zinc metallopeptidase [Thermopolyspora sp.]